MLKTRSITLATQNEGKRRELHQLAQEAQWPITFSINPNAPDIEETGKTFQENAILKARSSPLAQKGDWVLAEDSGLVIDALAGQYGLEAFPGIYANRWLTRERYNSLISAWPEAHQAKKEDGVFSLATDRLTENGMSNTELCMGILALMHGQKNRKARYCCAMALWNPDEGLVKVVEESMPLWITESECLKGQNGFGYDPIMHSYDTKTSTVFPLTVAEMSSGSKNSLSHRGKAFHSLFTGLF